MCLQWFDSRRLLVLYGSETGTAQELALRVAREGVRQHFKCSVMSMNECSVERLQGKFAHLTSSSELDAIRDVKLDEKRVDFSADDKIKATHMNGISDDDNPLIKDEQSDFTMSDLFSSLPPLAVVFIAATAGQGDNPENMQQFFDTLWGQVKNRSLLKGMKYSSIALGDSSYQKFNYAGKRLHNLLKHLGGNAILDMCSGDDQHDLGPDFAVDPWLKQLWEKLSQLYPMPEGVEPISASLLPPSRYKVCFENNLDSTQKSEDSSSLGKKSFNVGTYENPCFSAITMNKRVTADDHFQEVRLVEFDTSQVETKYEPGDVLMVQPKNIKAHVQEFITLMNLDPNRRFSIASNGDYSLSIPSYIIPQQSCTVEQVVTNYFDIMSVPKRYFFELLHFFTTDEDEREKFLEFASAEGQQDLYDYCNRPKRSILEVLADFTHTISNIPFEYLFDLIPMIKPRAYSVASSSLMTPNRAQILMAVVKYKTLLKRPRLGTCSNWLAPLACGTEVHCWFKKGTLKFLDHSKCVDNIEEKIEPVIMVGPGTGCAPFRSYILERLASNTIRNGPILYVFGCRNRSKDFFFGEEMMRIGTENENFEILTAFSRDQEDKMYVQHRIKEHAAKIWYLINEKKAKVYFAGNAKRVPIDVYEAFTYVCQKGLSCDTRMAENYMKKCFDKIYQTESWA